MAASVTPTLIDKDFRNWLKGALAVLFARQGLTDFVQKEITDFQNDLLNDVWKVIGIPAGTTCNACTTANLLVCPTHGFCTKGKKCTVHDPKCSNLKPNQPCPHNMCTALRDAILKEHQYRGPSWRNTDARGWCTDAYQLAKCYMPPDGYADKASVTETDFNGVIAVVINNKRFEKKLSVNFSSKTNICEQARLAGRGIRHSATHQLSDKDLVSNIDVFIQLLSDPVYLVNDAKAMDAVQKLKQLKTNTLTIHADDITSVLNDSIKATFNDQQNALIREIQQHFNVHKKDSVEAIDLKVREFIETGKVELNAQTEHGKDEINSKVEKGKGELSAQTEQGKDEINSNVEKGKGELSAQTEQGKDELNSNVEKGKGELSAQTEQGKDELNSNVEKGKGELSAQTEQGKDELNSNVEKGKGELSAQTEQGKDKINSKVENGKGELSVQTEQGKAELGLKVEKGKGEISAQTEQGKCELGFKVEKGKGEISAQTEQGKDELGLKVEKGKVELGAKTEKALGELHAQIRQSAYQLQVQTSEGKDELSSQIAMGKKEVEVKTILGKEEIEARGKQMLEEINRSAVLKTGNNDDSLLQEFKEELVRFYQNNESTIPASPLVEDHAVPLAELYVQPPMSAFIKPNAFGQGHKSPEKTTVSSYRKLLFRDNNVPYKNIYVEANAGYGKTSFTQNIAMTWCQPNIKNNQTVSKFVDVDTLPSFDLLSLNKQTVSKFVDIDTLQWFDLLFLLHLRDFQDENICLLDDLIIKFVGQSLPDPERFSEKFIKSMLRTRPCLVLCDGLDEWTHPSGKCAGKPGIPHNNYGDNCTVLTTTRPWKISTIGLTHNHIDHHVEISQLDKATSEELKSNAVKLLSENSGENGRDLTDFDKKVSSVKLGDIRLIPYILLQLICIWFDGLSIGKSKCETYSNTIELTLQRGLNKKNAPTLPTGNAEQHVTVPEFMRHNALCKQYMNLLLKVGKLAFYALFQKIKESSLVIESTTVLKFLTEQELEFCLKIGLLSQSKDRSKVSVKRYQVFFQHKSIQEFMAALYITSEWNNGTIKSTILEVCSSLSRLLEMENLLIFVCGMTPEVYTCISGELQTIVDLDSCVCQFRTDMYIDSDDDAWQSIKSYQSMQLECLQESLRNGNDSWPIPLYFVLDKHSLTYDLNVLKSIMQVNKNIGKSPQVSLNEKIVASMLSDDPPFVFMQSLDPGVFTSLETLRVEDCDKEPVWLADILTESARTLKCLTLSLGLSSLSAISITALTGLTCLQSLYLDYVNMTHSNLKCLYAYISQTTTLTQLRLGWIHCSDHEDQYRDCDVTLDLRLNELKMLHLEYVPCRELHVNPACLEKLEFSPREKMTARASATLWQDLRAAPVLSSLSLHYMTSCQEMIQTIPTLTQLQHLELAGIDMDDVIPRVSPEMTHLERVELSVVTMSSAAWQSLFFSIGQLPQSITVKLSEITMTSQEWRELLLSVGGLQHPVTVELYDCKGPSEEDWRTIVNVIKTTPTLSLLQDLSFSSDFFGAFCASLTLKNQ